MRILEANKLSVAMANFPGLSRSQAILEDIQDDIVDSEQSQTSTSASTTTILKKSKKKIRPWSEDDLPFTAPEIQYPYWHLCRCST